MASVEENAESCCPICDKPFPMADIELHVNRCIFLNSSDADIIPKRKRSPSPVLMKTFSRKPPKATHPLSPSPTKKPKLIASTTQNAKTTSSENMVIPPIIIDAATTPSTSMEKKDEKNFSFTTPLAKQMQPTSLDDFVGQNHVLGENTVLRSLLGKNDIPNMILWGPPGCGKTSLAGVIQGICKSTPKQLKYTSLCAATAGVKDVQNIVSAAKLQQKFGCRTVLFMDEIHRFNKKQQDIFLLHVEKGDIILVGATTENPSFSINSALLSRCRVIVLQKLEPECLVSILKRAVQNFNVRIVDEKDTVLEKEGYSHLIFFV